jgi:hypothetical protein
MLYFLLIIIAVGVLLASAGGRSLLNLIISIAVIGVVLYSGFWVVILAIAFFTSDTGRGFIGGVGDIFGWILVLIAMGFFALWLWVILSDLRDKEKRALAWKKFKNYWGESVKNKLFTICIIIFILFCLLFISETIVAIFIK